MKLASLARARAEIHKVLASHLQPRQLFFAMLVGAMVGATPFYGLHFVICVALAWLLRLNPPAMYAAANISLPPLIPLLGFACVQVGERVVRGQWLPLRVADFRELARGPGGVHALMLRFFVDWTVGGVLVGAGIGLVLGGAVYGIARRRRRAGLDAGEGTPPSAARGDGDPVIAEDIDDAIREASRRFRRAAPNLRWYAFFKYRMDPSYRRLAALIPPRSTTVDLGTGLGMLPLVLALLPGERLVVGLDWDGAKLAAGRTAAGGLPRLQLIEGDARQWQPPPCDVITLVDVLHYYEPAAQRALLERACGALRPGGAILVREGDAARRGGAAWTRALEALAVRIGWNRGDGATRFRGAGALSGELQSLGLQVTVEPLAGRLHPGNVLLCARKPVEAAAPPPPASDVS